MNTNTITTAMKSNKKTHKTVRGAIVKEVVPVAGGKVHGVTFDGKLVWYARGAEIVGYDPDKNEVVNRVAVPAEAGTAFDGEFLYQISDGQIRVVRPSDGHVVRKLPAPSKSGQDSGLAYADGYLWVGQYGDRKITQIDAKTGEVVKTLSSDRFVTGVSCVDGQLWHAASDGGMAPEIRRLADDGTVEEVITLGDVDHIAGMESDGKGGFWCGGNAGTLRLVRPTRA